MKSRLVAALAVVALLGTGIALAVGSLSDDALISKSYYEDVYLSALTEKLRQRAEEDTKSVYDKAKKELAQREQIAYLPIRLDKEDTLELTEGSAILLESGEGRLIAGTLADVTDGATVEVGQKLVPAHRYIVISDDGATIASPNAPGNPGGQVGGGTVGEGEGTVLPFADVTEGQWYYDAVAFVYRKGYFAGTGSDTFSPNAPMNRAMVATVLHRISGGETVSGGTTFSDVPAGQWYSDGIAWASAKGVVNGMGGDLYAPEVSVTREQLVTMLYRYQKDYLKSAVSGKGDLSVFSDGANVSDWAREAVSWAVGEGLLKGRDSGELDPAGTATRAEVATILQRFSQSL